MKKKDKIEKIVEEPIKEKEKKDTSKTFQNLRTEY